MPESQLTSKGQITLPKAIRDFLKLKTGDRVAFHVDSNGKVTMTAVTAPITSLKEMVPKPNSPVSVEKMNEAIKKRAGEG